MIPDATRKFIADLRSAHARADVPAKAYHQRSILRRTTSLWKNAKLTNLQRIIGAVKGLFDLQVINGYVDSFAQLYCDWPHALEATWIGARIVRTGQSTCLACQLTAATCITVLLPVNMTPRYKWCLQVKSWSRVHKSFIFRAFQSST